MATTPIKVLLFLAGGVAAAGVTAYVSGALDSYLGKPPVAIASLPAQPETPAAPAGEQPAEIAAATPGDAAAPEQVAPAGAPTFDILRVEPDGSLLVAGRATPGATVELLSGAEVIGSAVVGGSGDFT